MEEFTELCGAVEETLNSMECDFSARLNIDEKPPLALYHATLDGKEYMIQVVPTDLANDIR